MNIGINIEPTDEQRWEVFYAYQKAEKDLPAPEKKRKGIKFWLFLFVNLVAMIPALVIVIMRIPFIIIRKLRIVYLKNKYRNQFEDYKSWDPDMEGREFYFDEPKYKQTDQEKKSTLQRKEHDEYTSKLKAEYLAEKNLTRLADYAIYESYSSRHLGDYLCLYIFDQIHKLPRQGDFRYDNFYWNFHILADRIRLPNHASHFQRLAVAEGIDVQKYTVKRNYTSWMMTSLIAEAWRSLERDIKNCWPK